MALELVWLINSITANSAGAYLLSSVIFKSPFSYFWATLGWAAIMRCVPYPSPVMFVDFCVVGLIHLVSSLMSRDLMVVAVLCLNCSLFVLLNIVALLNPTAPLGPNSAPRASPKIIFGFGYVYLIRSAIWAVGRDDDSAGSNDALIGLFLILFAFHCLMVHIQVDLRRRRNQRRGMLLETTVDKEIRSIARVW